jgi:hypothetical protein
MTQQFLQTGRIANTAVTSDKIANTAITSDKIANTAITSDKIANSAITVDKIVNSSITSTKLSSNLSVSLTNVLETANIYTTAVGGNVNIDVLNNTVYFFSSNTTANVTFNFRGNGTVTLQNTISIGQSISSAILLKQSANTFRANVHVDGSLVRPLWASNSAPAYVVGTNESTDLYLFNIIRTGTSTYTILASNTKFSAALGQ